MRKKIIVSVPLASPDTVHKLKNKAEVRVLETPAFFNAVGEWYESFPQVSDDEVIGALSEKL